MADDDYMEIGDTHLVPIEGGWLLDTTTGNRVDPYGRIYDKFGELVYDPEQDWGEDYDHNL